MSQEELKQKIAKLEAEIAELKDVKNLLSARTALAFLGMENSAWRHSTLQKAAIIRNYTAIIRHFIKAGANPTDIDLQLEKIDETAKSIGEYRFAPPLSSEEGLEIMPVNPLIQEWINRIQQKPAFSDIQISLQMKSEPLLVRANRGWLVKGLELLVENSADAMASSVTKHLTIKTSSSQDQVHIFIEDTGKGVSADIKPLLFIQPIEKNKGEKGSGTGLLMAQMIFQSFGGGLALEKSDSQGSIFAVYLPQVE